MCHLANTYGVRLGWRGGKLLRADGIEDSAGGALDVLQTLDKGQRAVLIVCWPWPTDDDL